MEKFTSLGDVNSKNIVMHYIVFVLVFISSVTLSFSQRTIKGKVLHHQTKTPIPYVNIGIPESPVGILSNEDGTFSVSIPEENYSDTILFSALGFTKRWIPVPALIHNKDLIITLKEKTTLLESVVVTAKKEKKETFSLGNRFNQGGFLYADSISSGAAMALLIENKHPSYYATLSYPVFLEEVNTYINKNSFQSFKIRVRIQAYDSITGLPGEDLLTESVILTSSIKKGWLKIDLRAYNLVVYQHFFLVLEWILEDKDRLSLLDQYASFRKENPERVRKDSTVVNGKKIGFWSYDGFSPGTHFGVSPIPFSLQNYTCYYKTSSFSPWARSPVILTARVLVSNQPDGVNKKNASVFKENPEVSLDKFCNDFLAESSVNGFQLAVMKGGSLVFNRGYGYSDIQERRAVISDTRFRIGSISKSITSIALVRLVKDQKLDLDKPIDTYLPSLHFKYPVTTRQLAGHITGIRHYRDGDTADLVRQDHYNSSIEALSVIEKDTLLFKPGEKFLYSSFGWNIIGAIVEKTSGQRYLDYLRENIVQPFGLNHTSGLEKGKPIEDLSKGYLVTGEAFDAEDVSYKYPSGGLISSAEDLVAFGSRMLAEIHDPVTSQVFTSMHLNNGDKTNYGLGWNIGKDPDGHRIFFHTGNMINGSGFLMLYPDDNIVAAFLCNSPEGLSFDMLKAVSFFY